MNSDPETGLINFNRLTFFPAVGRIVLGTYEKLLLDRIAATDIPFITACDPLDETIPQVSFGFTEGIENAVEYLYERGCRKIGFIGQTQRLIHLQKLNKFHAYLSAIQKYCQVDPACIGSTRPIQGGGAIALQEILKYSSRRDWNTRSFFGALSACPLVRPSGAILFRDPVGELALVGIQIGADKHDLLADTL